MTSGVKGHRYPRASFENTLARIIQKIERATVLEVSWKNDFPCRVITRKSLIRVKSLWAAGSFARQEEIDNNCSGAGSIEALRHFAHDTNSIAALLEEFAAKFRQKAIELEERARVGNVGSPSDQT